MPSQEENLTTLSEIEQTKDESTMVAVATRPTPSPAPVEKELSSQRPARWLGNAFKINLKNFRPGGISLRKFSITEAVLLLVAGYLASRGLGLVRQIIFNTLFGTGPEANAYYAAYRLPETLFELMAGGALSHALIPVFISYENDHGRREVWRLASLVFNVLLVALTILLLIAEFVAPVFVSRLLVPGYSPAEQALTTSLTRVMLVQPLLLGVGTVFTAILNSKRQFLLPAISLAVYNVGLIGGLLCSLAIPGLGIYGPTYGVIAAALCQFVVMMPGLVKQGVRYSFNWNLKEPGLRDVLRLLGPNVLSVAIASTGFIVDTAFISFMPDKASLAAQRNAHLLFSLPQTLVAQAIGTAALPLLAALALSGRYVRFRENVVKVIAGSVVLSILASLFLYVLGKPLIHLFFQHGAFGKHSSAVTGTALMGYAVALPGITAATLLAVVFYAMKDAWTPLGTNIVALVIRWSLVAFLVRTLTGTHVILSVPLAAAGAGYGEAILLGTILYFRMRKKTLTDKGMQRLERRRSGVKAEISEPISMPVQLPEMDEADITAPEVVEETELTTLAELFLSPEDDATANDVPDEPQERTQKIAPAEPEPEVPIVEPEIVAQMPTLYVPEVDETVEAPESIADASVPVQLETEPSGRTSEQTVAQESPVVEATESADTSAPAKPKSTAKRSPNGSARNGSTGSGSTKRKPSPNKSAQKRKKQG